MDGYGRRRLSYPWSYVTEIVQPITIESVIPSTPPELSEECNSYTVHLTPSQVLKFTSAIQAGLDLLYPDNWQDLFTLWDNSRANVNNPFWTYSTGACSGLDICSLVAQCVVGSDEVRDAIRELIEQANNGDTGSSEVPLEDTLDCVYGATSAVYEILLDTWLELKALIDSAISVLSVLESFLPSTLIDIPNGFWDGVETLVDVGTALYDAWINAQAQEDAFKCGIFDSICQRGVPYVMTSDDIVAGFTALDGQSPPVLGILLGIRISFNFQLAKQAWSRATDDTCSNDWLTLCNCDPGCVYDNDFTVDNGGMTVVDGDGSYVGGTGWRSRFTDSGSVSRSVIQLALPDTISGGGGIMAQVLFDSTFNSVPGYTFRYRLQFDDATTAQVDFTAAAYTDATQSLEIPSGKVLESIWLAMFRSGGSYPNPGIITLKGLSVCYP